MGLAMTTIGTIILLLFIMAGYILAMYIWYVNIFKKK